jgi:hypothetical protein
MGFPAGPGLHLFEKLNGDRSTAGAADPDYQTICSMHPFPPFLCGTADPRLPGTSGLTRYRLEQRET